MVRMEPSGRTSLTALCAVSAMKTSPAASTAKPSGLLKPEPMGEATVGGKEGAGEYWKRALVAEPLGLIMAWSTAPVADSGVAAPVVTAGKVSVRNDCGGLCPSMTWPTALAAM